MQTVSEKLRGFTSSVGIELSANLKRTQFRIQFLKALREGVAKDGALLGDLAISQELDELEKSGLAAVGDDSISDASRPNEPLAFHPAFRREIDAARVYRFSDAAGLEDQISEVLIKEVGSISNINEHKLDTLLQARKLGDSDARRVGVAATLFNVLDERTELLKAVSATVQNPRELVRIKSMEWKKLLEEGKVKLPPGLSNDEYAEGLAKKMRLLFPTDALADRLARIDIQAEDARRLADRYVGMHLTEAKHPDEVLHRVGLVNRFLAENHDVLETDLKVGSEPAKTLRFAATTSAAERAMVLATARAYQRALAVAEDIADAEAIVAGGFPSATSLAMSSPKEIAKQTGLDERVASAHWAKAKEISTGVAAHAGTFIDVVKGGFADISVGNISPAILGYLKELPGFASFFGNQNYCNCTHCRSILGPAAYFVDLMSFVDKCVTQPYFSGSPNHPLNLKKRRPDLWALELTCENTKEEIPYLVLINEILENTVATAAGYTGNLADRAAVARKVYRDTLPNRVDSFAQPLNLAFEELRNFLGSYDRSFADIAEAGSATGATRWRLLLGLAPRDYILVTTPDATLTTLRRIYQIAFSERLGRIDKFDAQLLLKPMKIGREELSDLISTRFVTVNRIGSINIAGEKRSSDSVQNDLERIDGLTRAALDRMHRFVRLWRATGWRIGELDMVLTHLVRSGIGADLDAAVFAAVSRIHRLQTTRQLSVEELVALWSLVPQEAVLRSLPDTPGSAAASGHAPFPQSASPLSRLVIPLFDRAFNPKRFVDGGGVYPKPAEMFLHPALATTPPPAVDPDLHRLVAATGADEAQLLQLIIGLAQAIDIDPASTNDNRKAFALSHVNLTLLYRHQRLAKLLKVSVPQLFALATLARTETGAVDQLSDLEAVLDLHKWWKTTNWTLAQLVQLLQPGRPATMTCRAVFSRTAARTMVVHVATVGGVTRRTEAVAFAANTDLTAAVASWNTLATQTEAYRSDKAGKPQSAGRYLSVRVKGGRGDSQIEVTDDASGIFAGEVPMVVAGRTIDPPAPVTEAPSVAALAQQLVEQVQKSETLVFADSLFAQIRPTSPAMTSAAAVSGTTAGQTVTYRLIRSGRAEPASTVTFGANANLDAAVADWNVQTVFTRAFRSDASGTPLPTGNHLSVIADGSSGSDSRLQITADVSGLFTATVPREYRGAEITTEQSSALIAANHPLLEVVDPEGRYRLKRGFDPASPLAMPVLTRPIFTSTQPFASQGPARTVKMEVVVSGAMPIVDTVVLPAAISIGAAVGEWNAQATASRAYRSDASGSPLPAGTHLSVEPIGAGGQGTVLSITQDNSELFATGASQRRGAGVWVPPELKPALQRHVLSFHNEAVLLALLPGCLGVTAERVPSLLAMAGESLADDRLFQELRGDAAPASSIAALIGKLRPLTALFNDLEVFDAETLSFVRQHPALFGIADFRAVDLAATRRVELFRKLVQPWITRDVAPPDLEAILLAFTAGGRFEAADQAQLADVIGIEVGLSQSLQAQLTLATTPFEVLQQLIDAASLATHARVGGSALRLAQSTDYDDLAAASAAVQAAFRAQFANESEWEKRVEPLRNTLLGRQRDGLVQALISSGVPQFDELTDLYHYFLLDVQLEGCTRTSRVAAAIDSLQLYVQRCLMNLEETPPGATDPMHVSPAAIPVDEWDWRKHYRVWEANRKIFLYPENHIDPGSRDNKTPLFKQLEEELLAKEITEEAILDAYARYLRGFDELAHLTISGSYHEKDEVERRDVLHLFGVTADEPPIYHYRRVENVHFGVSSADRATHWGAWERVDTQIPVRKVAALVHQGQLYVFWNRYTSKSVDGFLNGNSRLVGYQHRAYVEFTKRRLDGSWTPPQQIALTDNPFNPSFFPKWYQEKGIILDNIIPKGDTLLGFTFSVEVEGVGEMTGRADAKGSGYLVLLGLPHVIQLPADSLSAYNASSIKLGDTTFKVTPIRGPAVNAPLYDNKEHPEAKDGYSLAGFGWDQLYPSISSGSIALRGFNFQMSSPVDLYRLRIGGRSDYGNVADDGVPWFPPVLRAILWGLTRSSEFKYYENLVWSRAAGTRRTLHLTTGSIFPCFDAYSFASVLLDEWRFKQYKTPLGASPPFDKPQWHTAVTSCFESLTIVNPIADISASFTMEVVNGSVSDVIIQTDREALYLQQGARADGKHSLRRLGTSVSGEIADVLYKEGLEELLSIEKQMELSEHQIDVNLTAGAVADSMNAGTMDLQGPMATYFTEIFFHIPFLVANHLNSQGRYEDAQRWYHHIFDPTADEVISGLPAGLSPEERRRRELDRNWRYREFRGLTLESLRTQLINQAAIEEYRRDPFNPHAIARLRIGAFQKSIVMKYVDNLLDWGDDLFMRAFSQLNPEYLREATLKYVMAQEILGERPARLGDCGESAAAITYGSPALQSALHSGSEFLLEVESLVITQHMLTTRARKPNRYMVIEPSQAARASGEAFATLSSEPAAGPAPGGGQATFDTLMSRLLQAPAELREAAARLTKSDVLIASKRSPNATKVTQPNMKARTQGPGSSPAPDWGVTLMRQINPVFCVPGNDRMLSYWDRVDDRLFKLRHCRDIDGVSRRLPLFAPEIDPALLVAGRAAGIGLDDILASAAGSLPPYRFRYLIEKAKGFAATVQGFGSALLSALEKRDGESLTKLRNVHQKNILAMASEMKRSELRLAEEGLELARRRSAAAQYRHDYYDGLITSGLSAAEVTETAARITATVASATQLGLLTGAGIAYLLPQVGSPFAMKYGGAEAGASLKAFSAAAGVVHQVSEMVASLSGIVAGFERREQGWEHQRELASHDLKAAEKDIAAAEVRKAVAERGIKLHELARDQHDEVMEFYGTRFTNLGLYTHLSRELQQLHRQAFNSAMALSRMAEQAYRFERPGDNTRFLGGEWDAARSGLLAGERLSIALQNMDKRFVETNSREAEINQNFSLAQIRPEALIDLKESGRCEFSLPEFFFDLYYPGQYRRRIRAVRLTLPSITGPYTNISARLSLLRSFVRRDAVLGEANLFEVPPSGNTSVATSSGQGDAGVFELNFRDERYMPFEGAGAVSEWRLELPNRFRPFDYDSITDVILNISYTAEDDETLRQQVESTSAALEGSLTNFLTNRTLTRVFSMRQEFSNAFNRLCQAKAGTSVTFDITDRHFPLFLQGRTLTASVANLVLAVVDRAIVPGSVTVSLNGTAAANFASAANPAEAEDSFGGLPAKPIGGAFTGGIKRTHTIVLSDAGNLAPALGNASAIDSNKLRDIMIVLEYSL